jgi:CYTH domain-containing protein
MYEIEKKFSCQKEKVMSFFQQLKKDKINVDMRFINQIYFHKDNARVLWNASESSWQVTLLKYNKTFKLKANKSELDMIEQTVAKYDINLVNGFRVSSRVRKSKQDRTETVLFTIKFPTDEECKSLEFEYEIEDYKFLDDFFEKEKACVKKTRYMFMWNNKLVELDIFINSDHIVLEVEFVSIEEMNNYSFNGLPIEEETSLSNIKIAFSHIK